MDGKITESVLQQCTKVYESFISKHFNLIISFCSVQHNLWNLCGVAVKVQTRELILRDLFHDSVSIAGCMYKLSGKTDD
jgi:hypothetical protein